MAIELRDAAKSATVLGFPDWPHGRAVERFFVQLHIENMLEALTAYVGDRDRAEQMFAIGAITVIAKNAKPAEPVEPGIDHTARHVADSFLNWLAPRIARDVDPTASAQEFFRQLLARIDAHRGAA